MLHHHMFHYKLAIYRVSPFWDTPMSYGWLYTLLFHRIPSILQSCWLHHDFWWSFCDKARFLSPLKRTLPLNWCFRFQLPSELGASNRFRWEKSRQVETHLTNYGGRPCTFSSTGSGIISGPGVSPSHNPIWMSLHSITWWFQRTGHYAPWKHMETWHIGWTNRKIHFKKHNKYIAIAIARKIYQQWWDNSGWMYQNNKWIEIILQISCSFFRSFAAAAFLLWAETVGDVRRCHVTFLSGIHGES